MASLRYRSGGWDLRYRERSGKERTERFRGGSTRRPPPAALERKGAIEAQLIRGTYVSRDLREQTFRVYYERWVASRQISATGKYTDDQRAAKHVLPYWGEWAICDIRPSDIDDWIGLLARTIGPHSVRHCYGLLRGPLRRAIKGRVIDNPCIDIVLPKKPDLRKTFDDVLTAIEVDRLVEAIVDPDPRYASQRTNGRYRAMVFMGCQPERQYDVHRGDVQDRRLAHGAGAGIGDGRVARAPEGLPPRGGAGGLPVRQRQGRPHPAERLRTRDVLAKAVKRAGLDGRRVTWLTLRHTAASLMFDAGLTSSRSNNGSGIAARP